MYSKDKLISLNGWHHMYIWSWLKSKREVNLCNDEEFYILNAWTDIWVIVET